MKNIPALRLIALACLTTATAVPAFAQDAGSFYGGASVGRARFLLDPAETTQSQTGQTATAVTRDDKDTGYKLFGGYQINPMFGVEAGLFDLGKSTFTATVPTGTYSGRIKAQGINLDLVGRVPVTQNFSVLARVGAIQTKTSDNFESTGFVPASDSSPSQRVTKVKVGAGAQYALSKSVLLRTEVERYRISDGVGNRSGHVNMLTVGVVVPFGGGSSSSSSSASPAYAPMAYVPAPAGAAEPMVKSPGG